MSSQLRMGIVGAGKMGTYHIRKCLENKRVHLVGIFDHHPTRALELQNQQGVTAFSTLEELLVDIDAVIISTSTPGHFPVSHAALNFGVHCLVEKPLSRSLEESIRMTELARERKLILQCGLLERIRVKSLFSPERIRESLHVRTARFSTVLGRDPELGVFLDLAIHDVDCMLSIMGEEPLETLACGARVKTNSMDIGFLKFIFSGGRIWEVGVSQIAAENRREWSFSEGSTSQVLDLMSAPLSCDPLGIQLDNFIDSVLGFSRPLVDGGEAVRAQALCQQAEELANLPTQLPTPEQWLGGQHAW